MFKRKFCQPLLCLIMASIYILGASGHGPTLMAKLTLPFSSFRCAGHGCGCDLAGYELEGCRCFTAESCCSSESPPEPSCCEVEPLPEASCCSDETANNEGINFLISESIDSPDCGRGPLQGNDFLAFHTIFTPFRALQKRLIFMGRSEKPSSLYTSPFMSRLGKIPIS